MRGGIPTPLPDPTLDDPTQRRPVEPPAAQAAQASPASLATFGWRTARRTLESDELQRTRRFIAVSSALAVVGSAATFLFGGHPGVRAIFLGAITLLLITHAVFMLDTRNPRRFRPWKAAAVQFVNAPASLGAILYYGLFSPAVMINMLTISFVGMSASFVGAASSYGFTASLTGAAMLMVALGFAPDVGLIQADELTRMEAVLYAVLVQAVYAMAFAFARVVRRATDTAVHAMEGAWRRVEQQDELLAEARLDLEQLAGRGGAGRLSGRELGGWRLGDLIGRGAMGDVYAATGAGGAVAALKVLHGARGHDETSMRMFEREAEALARVRSPHVIRLLGAGVEGAPYIAMERLEGEDLAAILRRRRRLAPLETVRLVREAAAGLEAAATAGLVHRDVKPSNLFLAELSDGGDVWKVLDFGVSKVQGVDLTITRDQLLGTPAYIAPEQVSGRDVDRRSDLFSLAAVAYRSLTGLRPFAGDNVEALLYAAVFHQPSRPGAHAAVPEDVDLVLAIALAKDPDKRFESAPEFAESLARALDGRLWPGERDKARAILAAAPWAERRRGQSSRT